MNTQKVAELYNRLTEFIVAAYDGNIHFGYWDDPAIPLTLMQATDAMTDQVIDRLEVAAGDQLLDIGCGTGNPALRIASRTDVTVTGITVSEQQVRIANKAAADADLSDKLTFRLADAYNLPFTDAAFDAALALESLCHMSDRPQALREAARVLKPGGHLVIADLGLRSPVQAGNDAIAAEAFCTACQLTSVEIIGQYHNLITGAGFRVQELTDVSDHVRPTYEIAAAAFSRLSDQFVEVMGADAFTVLVEAFQRMADGRRNGGRCVFTGPPASPRHRTSSSPRPATPRPHGPSHKGPAWFERGRDRVCVTPPIPVFPPTCSRQHVPANNSALAWECRNQCGDQPSGPIPLRRNVFTL